MTDEGANPEDISVGGEFGDEAAGFGFGPGESGGADGQGGGSGKVAANVGVAVLIRNHLIYDDGIVVGNLADPVDGDIVGLEADGDGEVEEDGKGGPKGCGAN